MTPHAKVIATKASRSQASRLRSHIRAFATRVKSLRGSGSGVSSSSPRGRRLALPAFLAALVTVLALGVGVTPALASEPPGIAGAPNCDAASHTSLSLESGVHAGELETHWSFEYSTTKGGPWKPVPAGSGTITQAEADKEDGLVFPVHTELTGLTSEVLYYVLFAATNSDGTVSQEVTQNGNGLPCETLPFRPGPSLPVVRNVTAKSAVVSAKIMARGFAVKWRYELSTEPGSPASWAPAPNGAGTITQAEVESEEALEELTENENAKAQGIQLSVDVSPLRLGALAPATSYAVRLFVENEPEPGVHKQATSEVVRFQTEGPPTVATFLTHSLQGEALRVIGTVNPNSTPSSGEQTIAIGGAPTGGTFSLAFDGQSTGATGTGDLVSGAATGTGDISAATGEGDIVEGSTTITDVETRTGAFAVGQIISVNYAKPVLPPGTTITAVGAGTLIVSQPAANKGAEHGLELTAASEIVTDVNAVTGSFVVGLHITGAGISANTFVTAVEPGAVTISSLPTAAGTGVALVASGDIVTNVATSTGAFVPGEAISGVGIPAGATIAAVDVNLSGGGTLTLSVGATASGSAVALSAGLPADASSVTVFLALEGLSSKPSVGVEGLPGGPYTVFFFGGSGEVSQPQITADASGLVPSGSTVTVATVQRGGEAYVARGRFQYISQEAFEAEGEKFAGSGVVETPEVDVGSGTYAHFVAADLSGAKPGETYRYRVLVSSNFPGNPEVRGEEQVLTVPSISGSGSEGSCENEALRTGASFHLPDCRAYEMLTPVDKEGAQEAFNYGGGGQGGVAVGEDGNHVMLENAAVNWGRGAGPTAGGSPYFFSREADGWKMSFGSTQPETGVNHTEASVFGADLTQFAFRSEYETSPSAQSPDVEFEAGPPGGPYVTVASVPRKGAGSGGPGSGEGWVAASAGFSKLILAVEDRTLAGQPTTTKSGLDLYEYAGGELRQVNVGTGTCGATMPRPVGSGAARVVSSDGSRVFFEAVPGSDCADPSHLYVRVNGGGEDAETLDIGAYRFLAANPGGSRVLISKGSGAAEELFLYDTETQTVEALPGAREGEVSEDLSTIYFTSREALTANASAPSSELSRNQPFKVFNIYRYDVPAKALSFLAQARGVQPPSETVSVSPEGRYFYFTSRECRRGSGRAGELRRQRRRRRTGLPL